jgi:hypothetical protein
VAGEGTLRGWRASALAVVVVLGGLAGHLAAGGASPPVSGVLLLLAVTAVVAAPLLGAPPSTGHVVALVVSGQGLVHLAFEWLAPAAHTTTSVLAHNAAMAHGSMTHLSSGSDPAAAHGHVVAVMSTAALAILVGHLMAAVAVGLWLAAGERAARTLVELAGRSVVDCLRTLISRSAVCEAATGADLRIAKLPHGWRFAAPLRASLWDGCAVSRRGPPWALSA